MKKNIEDKLSVAIGKYPDDPTFNALHQKFKTLSEHISSDSDAENNDEFPDPEAARSPNTDDAQKEPNTDGTELSQWWTEPETLEEIDITLALVKSNHKPFENTPLSAFSLGLTQEFEDTINENVRKVSSHTIPTPIPCPVPISSRQFLPDAPFGKKRNKMSNSYLENPSMTEPTRKELFFNHLLQSIGDYDQSLRSISLVLLPVVRSSHIFLFALDLNTPSFVIIDNLACEATISERYRELPTIVIQFFSSYLSSVSHPMAAKFANMENNGQQLQLDRLRSKYVTKILTADANMLQSQINQQVAQYQKIPAKRREEIKFAAARNIHKRLSRFS
ncbi:hypothetical protein L1887_23597 [Cichorium endivia]|nr:hypothetical protein L1887_23597 [Cichorium endivia]